jgi:hypothetical protein
MWVVLHTQHGTNFLQDAHTLQLRILGALNHMHNKGAQITTTAAAAAAQNNIHQHVLLQNQPRQGVVRWQLVLESLSM